VAVRHINHLFCIFDLSISKALDLTHPLSTRVVLQYDRQNNKKEIKILNLGIEGETRQRLLNWLDMNVDENIVEHLRSSEVDMDQLASTGC
jgi:hypothetical protein